VIEAAEPIHADIENPDLVVRFTGPDVDLLLANKAEMLLALEQLTMEMLGCRSMSIPCCSLTRTTTALYGSKNFGSARSPPPRK
jgi:hypothetical protein